MEQCCKLARAQLLPLFLSSLSYIDGPRKCLHRAMSFKTVEQRLLTKRRALRLNRSLRQPKSMPGKHLSKSKIPCCGKNRPRAMRSLLKIMNSRAQLKRRVRMPTLQISDGKPMQKV